MSVNERAVSVPGPANSVVSAKATPVSDPDLPHGGAHAPTCPYHYHGECLCWRSDPWRNHDLEGSDLVRDRGREAAATALGYEVPDARIVEALHAHSGRTVGEVEAELGRLEREFEAAGGRGVDLAERIEGLRIAAAVMRAEPAAAEAVPREGTFLAFLDGEIRVSEEGWTSRRTPTLTVSLDRLASILMDEQAVIDPGDVADLMAVICRHAARGTGTDAGLSLTEAERYEAEGCCGGEDPGDDDAEDPDLGE